MVLVIIIISLAYGKRQIKMQISLKLIDTNQQIYDKILKGLIPQVQKFMLDKLNILKKELPALIQNLIIASPEYNSILSGQLKYEFGLPDSSAKLAGLLQIWSSNLVYDYSKPKITNNKIVTKLSASALKVNFDDVLYSDYAMMYDSVRGYSLSWLEWLVINGNQTIIQDQEIVFGPNKYSRTGNAVMKPSSNTWSVPPEFAGTINDNWITRSIASAENDIQNLLNRTFA